MSYQPANTYLELTGLTAGALNADLVVSTDVSSYKWFSLQVTTVAVGGTISFQGSNDNTNWFSIYGMPSNQSTFATISSANFTGLIMGPITFRYFRARQTAWTSGSSTGTIELYSTPSALTTFGVSAAQNGNWSNRLQDGIGTSLASVAAFHNTDNQVTATGNALLTGGVAQLVNVNSNLDRQRGTGSDGISAIGISTGSAQFAMSYRGTVALAITLNASPQIITPSSMTGNVQGVPYAILIGTVLTFDTGVNQEVVLVTAVTTTTFTGIFNKSHSAAVIYTGFVYNQERDASGELDGATGAGTAVAVGYEYNGGHPDGIHNYDRERNLHSKGHVTQTITATTAAQVTITTATAPTGLEPGELITLSTANLGTPETAYVASNYVIGSTTIPLAAPLVIAGNTILHFETYMPNGPGLNGLLPFGIGIEEDVVYDPISGLFFIERAATQDAVSGQNLPMENNSLYNGATFDRERTASAAAGTTGTGLAGAGILGFDGTNFRQVKTDTLGNISVSQLVATTSALTSVAAAITSTTLLALNANRKGAYFYNDSTAILYIALAATAATTAYTVQLPANGYYEMPEKPIYTGAVTSISSAANGNVRVTELS